MGPLGAHQRTCGYELLVEVGSELVEVLLLERPLEGEEELR